MAVGPACPVAGLMLVGCAGSFVDRVTGFLAERGRDDDRGFEGVGGRFLPEGTAVRAGPTPYTLEEARPAM